MATEIRYVENVQSEGWLRVKLENGTEVSLPYYLKVEFTGRKNGRDYFTILEGVYQGKKASVKAKGMQQSYLSKNGSWLKGAYMIFEITKKELSIRGLGTFAAETDPFNPVPIATYTLSIPGAPHSGGQWYTGSSPYAKTWFLIGTSGSRFLHPGSRSAGCITVTDLSNWTKIYKHLINSRENTKSVGRVVVK